MKIMTSNKSDLMKASFGVIQSDLVIKNIQLVNVITGEIYPANVYVYGGMISHIETKDLSHIDNVKEVFDGQGKYLVPGFIDAHIHIESSMMTPRNFAKAVLPWGTTTIVSDPHEIGNVCGKEGVYYMHEISEGLPMRQFIDIPSCVPAAIGLENAGAQFDFQEIKELSHLKRCIGLAEVMDYMGVINQDSRMMDILDVVEKKDLYIQGHAPCLSGRELSTYLCGGPSTCHETRNGKEALEKIRNGMYVDACDSSIAKSVKEIIEGLKDNISLYDFLCFCTDDREADDILNHGHINEVVRHGIECGLDPIIAIKCASLNVAREIHITNLGAIAPGYVADMLLVDDLYELVPSHVFFEGRLVAQGGKMVVDIEDKVHELENRNTMFVKELSILDFVINTPIMNGEIKVNVIDYPTLENPSTVLSQIDLPVENSVLKLNDSNLKYVAVINRHKNKDTICLGVTKGFGTLTGALASSVSHDSHNLVIVYDRPDNAILAANKLIECGGGMCAVNDGKVLYTLELPLAGLMSLKDAHELSKENQKMKEAINQLGLVDIHNPLLRIVTLSLPVVPFIKITDLGLVDVNKKEFIPLFVGEL